MPRTREALEALPGVGRKTANVVLNIAFGDSTLAVDTHVFRVANRTGLAVGKTPIEVELRLLERVPEAFLPNAHHWLILHGRYVCQAQAAAVRGLRRRALVRLGAGRAQARRESGPRRRLMTEPGQRTARSARTWSSDGTDRRRAVDDARPLAADGVAVERVEPARRTAVMRRWRRQAAKPRCSGSRCQRRRCRRLAGGEDRLRIGADDRLGRH